MKKKKCAACRKRKPLTEYYPKSKRCKHCSNRHRGSFPSEISDEEAGEILANWERNTELLNEFTPMGKRFTPPEEAAHAAKLRVIKPKVCPFCWREVELQPLVPVAGKAIWVCGICRKELRRAARVKGSRRAGYALKFEKCRIGNLWLRWNRDTGLLEISARKERGEGKKVLTSFAESLTRKADQFFKVQRYAYKLILPRVSQEEWMKIGEKGEMVKRFDWKNKLRI